MEAHRCLENVCEIFLSRFFFSGNNGYTLERASLDAIYTPVISLYVLFVRIIQRRTTLKIQTLPHTIYRFIRNAISAAEGIGACAITFSGLCASGSAVAGLAFYNPTGDGAGKSGVAIAENQLSVQLVHTG